MLRGRKKIIKNINRKLKSLIELVRVGKWKAISKFKKRIIEKNFRLKLLFYEIIMFFLLSE